MKAGIVGASGYLGAELLRLLACHAALEVCAVQGDSSAGSHIAGIYPGLEAVYPNLLIEPIEPAGLYGCDVVFTAVPSGASQELVNALYGHVPCVVDLGADFRLKDAAAYDRWYGFHHLHPELLEKAVFGLPELFRSDLRGASLIAAPGCYVTAASLALAPFIQQGVIERSGIIVDAASGTSGAGRSLSAETHHGTVNENFTAYKLLDHRHTPEIEQTIGAEILFTPHMAPMTRGILATCYGRSTGTTSTDEVLDILHKAYVDEPFVVVSEAIPSTCAAYGSNVAHLTARFDPRTGWVVALCAIDNLTKGGAGQALQAANIALGLTETAGLPLVAVMP